MFSSSALLALAAAVSPALATVYITSPVGSTTWAAGQQQTISWKDDGTAPSLALFGTASVGVYVGSQQVQTLVQNIVPSVDVSTTSSIVFTPDPTVGENGAYYFIRFESATYMDPNNPQYPIEAFSSKYIMSGMTGTFSADVQAEINGASNATGAATPAATSTPSTPAAGSSTTSKTGTSSAASGTASAAGSAKNSASSVPISALTCAAGVAAAIFSAIFM